MAFVFKSHSPGKRPHRWWHFPWVARSSFVRVASDVSWSRRKACFLCGAGWHWQYEMCGKLGERDVNDET